MKKTLLMLMLLFISAGLVGCRQEQTSSYVESQPSLYTEAELQAAMDAIAEYNETHDTLLCYSWGIDEMNNCVTITVVEDMIPEAETLRQQHPCIQYEVDYSTLTPAFHENENSRDDITLTAEFEVYPIDVERITLLFENNSDRLISYTDQYFEVLQDGQWYAIPYRADVVFTSELPCLESGSAITLYADTNIRNYDFVPGTYRVGQAYCYEEDFNGENADYIAWAEFQLTDE